MNKITLGGIVFDPGPRREIRFGGNQSLVKQDIPGVGALYQDMGPDEEPITWSGSLIGATAVTTAMALDAMRTRGGVVELYTWHVPVKQVLIREFAWRLVRAERVDYDIALVVQGSAPSFTPPPDPPAETVSAVTAAAALTSATHVVAAGDTLWAIAERYMGDGNLWPAIATANGVTDPTTLQIGQTLAVPTTSEAPTLAGQYQSDMQRRQQLVDAVLGGGSIPLLTPD